MQMQMEDRLPGIWPNVVDRAEALSDFALTRNLCCDKLAIPNQLRIFLSRLVDTNNVLLRDN